MTTAKSSQPLVSPKRSSQMLSNRVDGKFVNSPNKNHSSSASFWQVSKAYFTAKRQTPRPTADIPVLPIQAEQLEAHHDAIFRLGHSTMLIHLNGKFILTDPQGNRMSGFRSHFYMLTDLETN